MASYLGRRKFLATGTARNEENLRGVIYGLAAFSRHPTQSIPVSIFLNRCNYTTNRC
jgi:hypothetical protein